MKYVVIFANLVITISFCKFISDGSGMSDPSDSDIVYVENYIYFCKNF